MKGIPNRLTKNDEYAGEKGTDCCAWLRNYVCTQKLSKIDKIVKIGEIPDNKFLMQWVGS